MKVRWSKEVICNNMHCVKCGGRLRDERDVSSLGGFPTIIKIPSHSVLCRNCGEYVGEEIKEET